MQLTYLVSAVPWLPSVTNQNYCMSVGPGPSHLSSHHLNLNEASAVEEARNGS